jgi:hydroxyacylglutathione hydrolase
MKIETLVVSPFEVNCYLIGDENTGEAIVIDPGDSADFIVETAKGLRWEIRLILSTHGHIDHVGAVEELKQLTGAPYRLHRADLPLLENLPGQAALFGIQMGHAPEVESYLEDGEIIRGAGAEFRVLHTPGHSPGSVSFYTEGIVFCGDLLFAGSIGRTDLAGGDYSTLIRSIRTRLYPLGDDTVVYTGHGPETTIGQEKRNNPFLNPIYL